MVIAIVDDGGVLKAFSRMDGAALLSVQVAQDKAYTAVGFGMPTHGWHDFIKDDPPLADGAPTGIDRLVIFGGGYPITGRRPGRRRDRRQRRALQPGPAGRRGRARGARRAGRLTPRRGVVVAASPSPASIALRTASGNGMSLPAREHLARRLTGDRQERAGVEVLGDVGEAHRRDEQDPRGLGPGVRHRVRAVLAARKRHDRARAPGAAGRPACGSRGCPRARSGAPRWRGGSGTGRSPRPPRSRRASRRAPASRRARPRASPSRGTGASGISASHSGFMDVGLVGHIGSNLPPDPAGRARDGPQLALLVLDGQVVAEDRGGEAALGADAEALEVDARSPPRARAPRARPRSPGAGPSSSRARG